MSVEASGGGVSVGSSDRSGGNNVGDECRIEIDQRFSEEEKKWFVSFEKALKVVNKTDGRADAKPKIQKVTSNLRDHDKLKKYFEPKMFSFSPYCRLHCNLGMADHIKVNLATEFLQQNSVIKEDLYEDIKKQIKELKDYYDDDFSEYYTDHELARMFLVDGCAILWFMYIFVGLSAASEMQLENLGIKTDYIFFLLHDFFLLENQLPYQLLQLIIRHTSKQDELRESIYKFIFLFFRQTELWPEKEHEILKDLKDDHVHILDLLRKMLIQPVHPIDEKRDLSEIIIGWIVVLFNKLKCNRNVFDLQEASVPRRNIGKLRDAGINLKSSKTSCVGDISFSGGTLKLPPIYFAEPTVASFLNMSGYEMCPDFLNRSEVTTYMYILSKFVDRTQDVEELREKNILRNQPGSDEEVVKLFNEISTHLIPNLNIYFELEQKIYYYFNNKGLMWLRKVSHDIHQYFKGRWSLLAFIGALLAVTSSIIQTVITVLAYQADSKKGRGKDLNPQLHGIGVRGFTTVPISSCLVAKDFVNSFNITRVRC